MSAPLLQVAGVSKAFGSTQALADVSLTAVAGEVHAVLGENGAGKSTLMAILAGALAPDAGELSLGGVRYRPTTAQAARAAGVAIVYQEPLLCDHLSVAENILLGAEPTRWGLVRRDEQQRRAAAALLPLADDEQRARLAPAVKVGSLGSADRQLVALGRALAQGDCRVLILDEPTSSLGAADTERLFQVVRRLRARGLCVLYITHYLEELTHLADRFTVLRDGRTVATGLVADTTADALVGHMVGTAASTRPQRSLRRRRVDGEVVLAATSLGGRRSPREASFELRRGEVLGIAGLVGSGRTELLRAIFGLDPVRRGELRLGTYLGPASPVRRLEQGVGLLSEDRKGEGLAARMSVADNLTLSRLTGLGPAGLVLPGWQRREADRWIERLGIRCRDGAQPVGDLSGGNQQKVALARLLRHDVDVALLDEPTRGIDVQSRAAVLRTIDELVERDKAVLMVSSYLPELLMVCDRIAVMRRGVLGPARPVGGLDAHQLLAEASGA